MPDFGIRFHKMWECLLTRLFHFIFLTRLMHVNSPGTTLFVCPPMWLKETNVDVADLAALQTPPADTDVAGPASQRQMHEVGGRETAVVMKVTSLLMVSPFKRS